MTDEERRARLERLSVDVDTRLAEMWEIAWAEGGVLARVLEDPATADAFGCFVRAVYGCGYSDALREDREGKRNELGRANGYVL